MSHLDCFKALFCRTIETPAIASVVAFLVLGPELPVAHAALTLTPDTPGATGTVPIRSYRPDLDLDSDDNGILDWIQIANGRPLDGIWTPELAAIQRIWLSQGSGNPGNPGTGNPPPTPAQQKTAALEAILVANDDGAPAPDSDHDGFSDYEEDWKKGQLPTALKASIDVNNREKRPPAYRYAIVDLGKAAHFPGSCVISHKNGWVAFYTSNTSLVRWHFGKRDSVSISDPGLASNGTNFRDISNDGRMLFTYYKSPGDTDFSIGYKEWDNGVVNSNTLTNPAIWFEPAGYDWNSSHSVISYQTVPEFGPIHDLLNGVNLQNVGFSLPGIYANAQFGRQVFPFNDGSIIYTGVYYASGGPVFPGYFGIQFLSDAAIDKIGVGFDAQGTVPQWFNLNTETPSVSVLPDHDPSFNTTTHAIRINSPLPGQTQHITCGHQIWSRLPSQTPAFGDPQDLRHLIDFSEPWLDLSATGISDEGFIVGIGKKLKEGVMPLAVPASVTEVARFTAAGVTIKNQKIYGGVGSAYGPVDPEKCGLWDHDITHYDSGDYEDHAFMLIPLAIRTDANRDGAIRDDGSDTLGSGIPWRFWVNDDSDSGDFAKGGSDIPGIPVASAYDPELGETITTPLNNEDVSSTVPALQVHGRTDLPDWFPAYIDGKELLEANDIISGRPIRLTVIHPSSAVHATYGNMAPDTSIQFQTKELNATFGLNLAQPKHEASAFKPLAETVNGMPFIPSALETAIKVKRGHVIMDGIKETRMPLKLAIVGTDNDGNPVELAAVRLPLAIKKIFDPNKPDGPNNFFQWINLRDVCDKPPVRATNTSEPINRPDTETNSKQFVAVHGFNVDEQASTAWASEFYKRFFWAESRAKMTFVSWQGSPPGGFASGGSVTDVCRDYYQAVRNAFVTAPALAESVNALSGEKVVAAHSLGNMLVSSAIVHHGLTANGYFLLNAAVPQEAYDANDETRVLSVGGSVRRPRGNEGAAFTYHPAMRHPDWDAAPSGDNTPPRDAYPQRALTSEFHTLVPIGDSRSRMTWRGVFAGLSARVPLLRNYYSPGEEVLEGSEDGRRQNLQNAANLVQELWFNQGCWMGQEWNKGFSPANWAVTTSANRADGGWSFRLSGIFLQRAYLPWEVPSDDGELRKNPAFTRFGNDALHDADNFTAFASGYPDQLSTTSPQSLGHLLAAQIPALSDPTGSGELEVFKNQTNPTLGFNRNFQTLRDGWPAPRLVLGIGTVGTRDYEQRWLHSDLKNMAYRYLHPLYEDMVKTGGLDAAPGAQ